VFYGEDIYKIDSEMTVDTLHAVTFYTIYAVTVHVICTVLLARNKKIEKNGMLVRKKY